MDNEEMSAQTYRNGQIALLRTRDNDTIIAGVISLGTGEPRFYTAHHRWASAYTIPVEDTDKYTIQVFDQTLIECRAGYQGFDECYHYAQHVLDDIETSLAGVHVVVTATVWMLQSGCVNPELLRDPSATPAWLQTELAALIEKADQVHFEFMSMTAAAAVRGNERVLN